MKTRKITSLAMLTAAALVIFVAEAQLPPLVPIPGVKLGLSNVVTLVTLAVIGRAEAFTVLMLRIILGSVFAGSATSFLYSAAGGILCFAAMAAAMRFLGSDRLWVVSIIGALSHNIGQICVAVVITSTWQIAAYLPVLIISAVITGAFTGLAASFVVKHDIFSDWRDK